MNYKYLSEETENRIKTDRANGSTPKAAFDEEKVIRRDGARDKATVLRTAFIRDIDKIMHCPYYNRYTDKTQVFSFHKNDDITRRALHVQLVSRTISATRPSDMQAKSILMKYTFQIPGGISVTTFIRYGF